MASLPWSQIPVSIVVDHVIRNFAHPDFRLPGDVLEVLLELPEIRKRTHIDDACRTSGQHLLELNDALRRHGTVRRHGLHQEQPISLRIVEHDVRQFVVIIDRDAEPLQGHAIDEQILLCRVAQIQ